MSDERQNVCVVVFAKAPQPGRVMTRLGAEIGQQNAVGLFRCFLTDIARQVGELGDRLGRPIRAVLAHAGSAEHDGFEPFRQAGFEFTAQGTGDLGTRLACITHQLFSSATDRLIIIGTDSPTLSASHFQRALVGLEQNDVTIGPSFDGGYYLLGLRSSHTEIFKDIDWSTSRVFGQTVQRCRRSSLLYEALEFWYDVDTFDDLKMLQKHLFDHLRYREPEIARTTSDFLAQLGDQGVFADSRGTSTM